MTQKGDSVLVQDYFHCICPEIQKNTNDFFKFENEIVKPIMDHIKNNGELLIRIEDVLNGKYRFVEGQPVRRSYVDMETMKESKTIEFSDRVVEYMKNQLEETLLELENLDVEITSKCPSTFYCAKSNIIEVLELLECD